MTEEDTFAFKIRAGETDEVAGKRLAEEAIAWGNRGYKHPETGTVYAPGTRLIGLGEVQDDGSLRPFPGMYEMMKSPIEA